MQAECLGHSVLILRHHYSAARCSDCDCNVPEVCYSME